jgi:hypothetical protein
MGKYDSHKHHFQARLNQWQRNQSNNHREQQTKAMPVHVVEVAKDFIKVAFETANGIFTPPIVKIPKGHSQYSREPTQVGDKGHAAPGDYYQGGATGDAGGNTNFYPRSNLTSLVFHGLSQVANPSRIVDQLTHMAGPAGWIVNAFVKQAQQQKQGQQGQQGTSGQQQSVIPRNIQHAQGQRAAAMNVQRRIMAKARGVSVQSLLTPTVLDTANAGGSQSGQDQSQQQQQDNDKTNFSFDKDALATVQSKDTDHNITVDSKGKKITLNVPVGEKVYVGGDGKKGQYARIMTEKGPSKNSFARIG